MQFDNRSRFVDPANDEELHHDLFTDLLRAAIQRHGTIREVAARAGYSEVYLSYILLKTRNVPPLATLESIIAAIPDFTMHEAQAVRRYARIAGGARSRTAPGVRLMIEDAQISEELERLEAASHQSTRARPISPWAASPRSPVYAASALVR